MALQAMFKEDKVDTDFLGSERQSHWKIGGGQTRLICAIAKYHSRKVLPAFVLIRRLTSVKCTGIAG